MSRFNALYKRHGDSLMESRARNMYLSNFSDEELLKMIQIYKKENSVSLEELIERLNSLKEIETTEIIGWKVLNELSKSTSDIREKEYWKVVTSRKILEFQTPYKYMYVAIGTVDGNTSISELTIAKYLETSLDRIYDLLQPGKDVIVQEDFNDSSLGLAIRNE